MMKEQMNIVIVGHVDHGKSTVIGRLLADTGSLPKGKLEQVKATCEKNAKPFEYAFLLDALKDEQSQGITIDTARCFFKTQKRDYIIIDAPGHIEFLKNMVTGAARAQAALLVIDANEGIQENSKRHGHMVSMLGIKQVAILINKMDLVNYNEEVFKKIKTEYSKFLKQINVQPSTFIPTSAFDGDNIVSRSKKMLWYKGLNVVEQMDAFKEASSLEEMPFRMPVQDIYKFTKEGDDRRIVVGTIESGKINVGDDVLFLPSRKRTNISTIEEFNVPIRNQAKTGDAVGYTLTTQIYIKPGELMTKANDTQPFVSTRFRSNIFWVAKAPMIKNKTYKLKLASARTSIKLVEIINVLDASDLTTDKNKQQIDRHDVAECIFETGKPIAFDLTENIEKTSRFVIVDNYEIAGGGIVLENIEVTDSIIKKHIRERESIWEKGFINTSDRINTYKHRAKFIVITGQAGAGKRAIAKELEKDLFGKGFKTYYLGLANIEYGLASDMITSIDDSEEKIRRLGELARIMTDSGLIFITTIDDADDYDIEKLKVLNEPNEILVINVGINNFVSFKPDLEVENNYDIKKTIENIYKLLSSKDVIIEYNI